MAKKEQFGKFVLLQETDRHGWGSEYRAAKLGSAGLERIVTVTRLAPSISNDAMVAGQLMEQFRFAAQLQNPEITRVLAIGRVGSSHYVCSELVEGKPLKAMFARSRQEGFPSSLEHALLIASKVCAALEYAHGHQGPDGRPYFHGFLNPGNVCVSYEAEVHVSGFGLWPGGVYKAGAVAEEEARYLAPEQAAGGAGDPRSDIFSVGALLFETLTGTPLIEGARGRDLTGRLAQARLQSPFGEDDSIPGPVREVLAGCLATDPERRVSRMQELRRSLDALLFSGDIAPTTFNLAFFMHSLFRGDIDQESRVLEEEMAASYDEYLTGHEETPAPGASPRLQVPPSEPEPIPAGLAEDVPHVMAAPVSREPTAEPAMPAVVPHEPVRALPEPVAVPSMGVIFDTGPGRRAAARRNPRGKLVAIAGVAALIAVIAGGIFFALERRSGPGSQPPAAGSSDAAALAKIQDLKAQMAALEAQSKAAQAAAAARVKRELEAQAKARGQAPDPVAVAQAQDAARRQAEAEHDARLQAERQKLEEQRQAEEARLAEEQRKAEEARLAEQQRKAEAARLAAAATTTPTPVPTAIPTPPPPTPVPVRAGMLVDLNDKSVIPPSVQTSPRLEYPRLALRRHVEGVVELNALVDEHGKVLDVRVVKEAGGKMGLTEAAVKNLEKRRYHPATKNGVPVKVWLPVSVKFRLAE